MNDFEVTLLFKLSAPSDDSVYDIIDEIMANYNDRVWDTDVSVEQLTFSEVVLEEIE